MDMDTFFPSQLCVAKCMEQFFKCILVHRYFQLHFFQLEINLHKDGKDVLAWKVQNSAIRYSSTRTTRRDIKECKEQ